MAAFGELCIMPNNTEESTITKEEAFEAIYKGKPVFYPYEILNPVVYVQISTQEERSLLEYFSLNSTFRYFYDTIYKGCYYAFALSQDNGLSIGKQKLDFNTFFLHNNKFYVVVEDKDEHLKFKKVNELWGLL